MDAFDPPPTYSRSVCAAKAMPSHASATGVVLTTCALAISMTLIEGGRYPPFSTRRYLPSGESVVAMGSVLNGICLPTGSSFHPLLSRNPLPGSGPTCSRGTGCEATIAARTTTAAATANRLRGEPGIVFIDPSIVVSGQSDRET